MLVQQPSKYLDFFNYCKQRRLFCKSYHKLKAMKALGEIGQTDYVKALRNLQHGVIELEIRYFDILHMRI
ncbi:hypothetical protein MTsPCn5_01380 [Croceitalea sp. MTPC5]|uniref:hypothetical protein n=1 Tax=Croceitalea sp. MTPC5 TaxID=3056565 RepID=UPI002B3D2A4C|nr:hypothetical protein MTsPCn5_01380 [Croceitalea sp. MTPC5]